MTNDTAQVPARTRYCRTNEQVRADILSAIGRILRERRGGVRAAFENALVSTADLLYDNSGMQPC